MVEVVNSVEALTQKMKEMKAAQREFATYSQEQVDKIFFEAAMAANAARIPLAKMAVAETGMGIVEDKVIKNHYASEYIFNAYRDTKTCGVIEEDKAFGIKKIAEPIGLVAAVIPTTNPTSTAIFKVLLALKTRNAIIISPHPRAKNSTIAAAKLVLEAAVKAGAPEGIVGWIDEPSLELTNEVMREADIILATGGPGMVKAAYSSGKPALGVGAGNTPVIIDDTADIKLAVNSIIHSKTFDNGMICASEQSVTVMEKVYKEVKAEFALRGCYFLKKDEIEKVRKTIIINGALNAKIVGQKAHTIAKLADVEVPEDSVSLEVTDIDLIFSNVMVGEKWEVIDYEWTFMFPIPIKYVIYRAFFLAHHQMRSCAVLELEHLMNIAKITPEERVVFQQMEENFQRFITGNSTPFRDFILSTDAKRTTVAEEIQSRDKRILELIELNHQASENILRLQKELADVTQHKDQQIIELVIKLDAIEETKWWKLRGAILKILGK